MAKGDAYLGCGDALRWLLRLLRGALLGVVGTCVWVMVIGEPLWSVMTWLERKGVVETHDVRARYIVLLVLIGGTGVGVGVCVELVCAAVVRVRQRKLKAQSVVRCRRCGYDMRGNVSGRCPECGAKGD